MNKLIYDVAVVGGGAAGMIAAGRAAEMGAKVVLIEKNSSCKKQPCAISYSISSILVNKTEFNFIKDKLMFSWGVSSTDLLNNFEKLKNIIIELYGEETGNKILTKLTDAVKT